MVDGNKVTPKGLLTFLDAEEHEALIFHLFFALVCVITLLLPFPISIGIKMTFLVLLYVVTLPLFAYFRNYADWIAIWIFALSLSIFQLFPDWFLAEVLEVLVFPDDGFLRIGPVSLYMAGLWTIPIFIIVYAASRFEDRTNYSEALIFAGLMAFIIFTLSEQLLTFTWYAQSVNMIGNVALYIIIPEILFGISAFAFFRFTRNRAVLAKVGFAFITMSLYIGNSALFYLVIERILV